MTTGEIIRAFRIRAGMTQEELGDALGVQKSAIQKYENGSVVNLKLDVIRKLCGLFRVPPWLFIFPEYISEKTYKRSDFCDCLIELYDCYDTSNFFYNFSRLNHEGREKILTYASDLSELKKYESGIELYNRPYKDKE